MTEHNQKGRRLISKAQASRRALAYRSEQSKPTHTNQTTQHRHKKLVAISNQNDKGKVAKKTIRQSEGNVRREYVTNNESYPIVSKLHQYSSRREEVDASLIQDTTSITRGSDVQMLNPKLAQSSTDFAFRRPTNLSYQRRPEQTVLSAGEIAT